jgi:hypothetical protein
MTFRRSDLQEAFFVPGTCAFRVYGYGTSDRLEEVLAPGYFGGASGLLRPGDLIYVRTRADGRPAGAEPAVRMALVMVRSGARGAVNVRLVQDFGRTDEPDALAATGPALPALAPALPAPTAAPATPPTPPTPPKRGRGRPPGSRNKKNRALAAPQLN